MAGRLILCAGPIGNLGDAAPRLGEVLAAADVVYAEDTRRARILLDHFGVSTPVRSYFVGNEAERAVELASRLEAGETVALLTDAGTPGIADPGLSAVRAAVAAGAEVTAIPGPSAVTMALAVSGEPGDRFVFEGFLPRKAGERARRLAALAGEERTLVFFEAPHRTEATLTAMAEAWGADRAAAVCRELTKTHEQIRRGGLTDLVGWAEDGVRGEVTIVVAGAVPESVPADPTAYRSAVADLEAAGTPRKEAISQVAKAAGVPKREVYDAVHRATEEEQ